VGGLELTNFIQQQVGFERIRCHERKPGLANLQVVSIQHTWDDRSLCSNK